MSTIFHFHGMLELVVRGSALLLLVFIIADAWPDSEKGLTPIQVVKIVFVVMIIFVLAELGYLRGCDESVFTCN